MTLYLFYVLNTHYTLSGRCYSSSRTEKACSSNARRVPSAEQNSFPAKPPRICHQRPAVGFILPVCWATCQDYDFSECLFRYPNLHEVRLIPTKKDIAFVEYMDEGSATIAKDALHNYKLDGENKIKVISFKSDEDHCANISSRSLLRGSSFLSLYHTVPHCIRVESPLILFSHDVSLNRQSSSAFTAAEVRVVTQPLPLHPKNFGTRRVCNLVSKLSWAKCFKNFTQSRTHV